MTPDLRRWRPTSDVQAAIREGVLSETHYLDVKREVGHGDGERANIARHLASLAIDGGSLLIGLEEDKPNRTWLPKPQPLDGLPERVEQIATHLVDPPLYTVATELPSGDPGHGYLLVEVPASPLAPHMVGGIYYGRGDRTRIRLSDAEVLRYHARRQSLDNWLTGSWMRKPLVTRSRTSRAGSAAGCTASPSPSTRRGRQRVRS